MRNPLAAIICSASLVLISHAQGGGLRSPSNAIAGNPASIPTTGSGSATLYLFGPDVSLKREIRLGDEVQLEPKDLQKAGKYTAVACAGTCQSVDFFVSPAKPASLTFLVHPSRAPVADSDVINGVALPFDEFYNLVVAPATVDFQLAAAGQRLLSQAASTQNGVAWFRTNSGRSAGALQITASVNGVSTRRVVQQVASDPCRLRIKGERTRKAIVVETEPVRDCDGNPVPDGTIVTFTAKNGRDTSTVDAPIKQGIAKAQITAPGAVDISAASGVVMGNELHVGARQ